MRTYTKPELIARLREIRDVGFVPNARHGNHGGVGNTLEDLLDIEENNLPLPNASDWELKAQGIGSGIYNTLFHMEPSPRAMHLVPRKLLPLYGWPMVSEGIVYPASEKSFRQTIHARNRSDRGFKVVINENVRRVEISFDATVVDPRHAEWLASVNNRIGLAELNPQPYWGFDDLFHKAGTKLRNCFFVQAEVKHEGGRAFYHYTRIRMMQGFILEKFLDGLREGWLLVDFDARTGHNHGTKFRLHSEDYYNRLYTTTTEI